MNMAQRKISTLGSRQITPEFLQYVVDKIKNEIPLKRTFSEMTYMLAPRFARILSAQDIHGRLVSGAIKSGDNWSTHDWLEVDEFIVDFACPECILEKKGNRNYRSSHVTIEF